MYNKSNLLFKKALRLMPGGVNSPVRSFKSVDMEPLYMTKGKGSKIYDIDGNEYIDYVSSWGPLILGHADNRIIDILLEYGANGTSFGANTEIEVKLAELITQIYPSIELIRMVSSGTEATMSAIRLARGYTGRNKIIKFEGCYHGHADCFLIKAGSGVLTQGIPGTLGITKNIANDTLIAKFNDLSSVEKLISSNKNEIASLIIEPVMGNAGVIIPDIEFLKNIRKITSENNIVLIFDEVITGFRVALGGAQELYNIIPDMTCLGKIIGGGLPAAAFGGKKEIMEYLAPIGPVYQAGTLSGNPLAMAVGYETINILREKNIYASLEEKSSLLETGFKENLKKFGLNFNINRVGSMMCLFFTEKSVKDFGSAMTSDAKLYTQYFKEMLKNGVYLAPSAYETCFVSSAHNIEDINKTIEANYNSLKILKK